MSRQDRHEGVSCDGCGKENFRGRRHKCLVCFDYDLCPACYDKGQATQRHTTDHPMQCILTQSDYELYYAGENTASTENFRPQSFSCPFCRRLGFNELTLREHISRDHPGSHPDVICPVCAAMPNGEPNRLVSDLVNHLINDHSQVPRASAHVEREEASLRAPRRTPAVVGQRGGGVSIRGNRRAANNAAAAAGLFPTRDIIDPITELLSQLGGLRRTGTGNNYASTLSQIQQLQQVYEQVAGRQGRRLLAHGVDPSGSTASGAGGAPSQSTASSNQYATAEGMAAAAAAASVAGTAAGGAGVASSSSDESSQFLLPSLFDNKRNDEARKKEERERQNRSVFVQDLFMSMLPTVAQGPPTVAPLSQRLTDPAATADDFCECKSPPLPKESEDKEPSTSSKAKRSSGYARLKKSPKKSTNPPKKPPG